MSYNYQGLIDRIASNSGIKLTNSPEKEIIKRDVYDAIIKILRKTEAVKNQYDVDIYDGTTPVNVLVVEASGGAGAFPAGTYNYKLSYTTLQGDTDLSDDSVEVILPAGLDGIDLSDIPVRPHGVTAVNIWRTKDGGTIYYLVTSLTNDAVAYLDTTLDTALTTVATAGDIQNALPMPADFFFAYEALFYTTGGYRTITNELTEEEFLRWNPDILFPTTSFNELVQNSTPEEIIYTEENSKYDGSIGFCFIDRATQQIKWNPAMNGSISIFYASVAITEITALTATPQLHHVFKEIIVDLCTVKALRRKLLTVTTEVQVIAINKLIGDYKKDYEEGVLDYAGFVNKDVNTPRVDFWDFQNDSSMLILGSDW